MKTLETIYKKLNSVEKTELETHKVELGIADDIKKANTKTDKFFASLDKMEQKMETVFKKYVQQRQDLITLAKKVNDEATAYSGLLSRADSTAKELGVSSKDIKGYNELENSIEKVKNYSKNIKNLYPLID